MDPHPVDAIAADETGGERGPPVESCRSSPVSGSPAAPPGRLDRLQRAVGKHGLDVLTAKRLGQGEIDECRSVGHREVRVVAVWHERVLAQPPDPASEATPLEGGKRRCGRRVLQLRGARSVKTLELSARTAVPASLQGEQLCRIEHSFR
jgi:hypothetical protein